ncbi:MAG TPA: cation transporter [Mycobacteriales bacterium]|nr:cation transporter [Mycobacteriales bacterium]
MRPRTDGESLTALLRSARSVSMLSICWTSVTGTMTVVLGLLSGSVVLTAFGAVGAFDAVGSAVLVAHFGHALRRDAISTSREQLAHLVVSSGLLIVGIATATVSALRLADGSHAEESLVGIVVAAVSVVALGYLALVKRRLGRAIPSHALVADGWLSLAGCAVAIGTVAGTALAAALGWWWADPVTAVAVAAGAIASGSTNLVSARGAAADHVGV